MAAMAFELSVHANDTEHGIQAVRWGRRWLPRRYTARVFNPQRVRAYVRPDGSVLCLVGRLPEEGAVTDCTIQELWARGEPIYELDIEVLAGSTPTCTAIRSEKGLSPDALAKIRLDRIVRQATALISDEHGHFGSPMTSNAFADALAEYEARHGTKPRRKGAIGTDDLERVPQIAWAAYRSDKSVPEAIMKLWPCSSRQHAHRLLNRAEAAGYDVPPQKYPRIH